MCEVCGGRSFTPAVDVVICDRCGAMYNIESCDLVNFNYKKFKGFFEQNLEKVKNEEVKGLLRGFMEVYVESFVYAKMSKRRSGL